MPQTNTDQQNRFWHWLFWALIWLSLSFFLVLAAKPGARHAFDSEPVESFSDGWHLVGSGEEVKLPTQLKTNGPVRIAKTIPADLPNPAVLNFRTAHQRVRLFCDGQLIYSFGHDTQALFGKSPGSIWNMARLPDHSVGEELVLELDSPYALYQGRLNSIEVGGKAAHLFFILRQNILSLLLSGTILVAGLVMLLFHGLVLRKVGGISREMLYLGLFSVFISMWLFGEGGLTQFFSIPPAFNTAFTAVAMLATPIPLLLYFSCGHSAFRKKLLLVAANMQAVLLLSCLTLQMLGILDLTEQIVFFSATMGLSCIAILYAVIYHLKRHPSAGAKRLLVSVGILATCFVLETVDLYQGRGIGPLGRAMQLGVLVFIAVQALAARQDAAQIMQLSRFATVDALTGCQNRAAYSQWREELTGAKNVGVVIADINDLKFINDNFGHETGDDAIIRCAHCFIEAFASDGHCFRIGGDEFAMLGSDLTMEWLQSLGETFEIVGAEHAQQTTYPFVISYGFAIFDPACDTSLTDTIKRADHMMYRMKRTGKQAVKVEKA